MKESHRDVDHRKKRRCERMNNEMDNRNDQRITK